MQAVPATLAAAAAEQRSQDAANDFTPDLRADRTSGATRRSFDGAFAMTAAWTGGAGQYFADGIQYAAATRAAAFTRRSGGFAVTCNELLVGRFTIDRFRIDCPDR